MNDEQEKEALTRYYLLRENNKAIQRKMGVSKAKLYRIYDSALENFEILQKFYKMRLRETRKCDIV